MTEKFNIQAVVLCGGSGARLWPLSRSGFPQQFLCMTGTESLFQQAAKRLMDLKTENIQVANTDHIDRKGLFVGNHYYPILEANTALRSI
jgi:mannose-1-phosphate guanylyltransferase